MPSLILTTKQSTGGHKEEACSVAGARVARGAAGPRIVTMSAKSVKGSEGKPPPSAATNLIGMRIE